MNVKLIAIVLIAILGVSSIGAYLVISSNDDGSDDIKYSNRLMIYGNANGDDYLDDNDVKKIQSIIDDQKDGNPWLKADYPYADADCDGDVDEDDLAFVKRMVAREHMTIYFLDTDGRKIAIDYPVNNVAAVSTVTFDPLTILGLQEKVVARHGQKAALDTVRHSYYSDLPAVGKNSMGNTCVDISMFSNVASTVPGGIDAIITRSEYVPEDIENILRESGTVVVRLGFGSIYTEAAAVLNLGYLMNAEEESHEYIKFIDEVEKIVDDTVERIPMDKRPTVLTTGGRGDAIMSNVYADSEWSIKAGAINNATPEVLGSDFAKYIEEGDTWQYSSTFDADFLLYTSAIKYDKTFDDYVTNFAKMEPYFGEHDCYPQDTVVLSTQIPSIVGALYFAQLFYPDEFTENLADKYLQTYIDDFLNITGYKVSEHTFFVTYEDVKDKL